MTYHRPAKECYSCSEIKPAKEFDKHQRSCRDCKVSNTRTCKVCNQKKNLEEFRSKSYYTCLACSSDYNKEWYEENRIRETKYGLKPFDIPRMLLEQMYECMICSADIYEDTCHVDHYHDTGEVRALLCVNCNVGLGKF